MADDEEQDAARRNKNKKTYNVYRTGLLIFSSLYTFLFAGAFFGYGPMILLLQEDAAFLWKCTEDTLDGSSPPSCPDQESSLLNVHFVATLTQMLTPFVGHLCDTKGPFALMFYTAFTAVLGVGGLILSRALPLDQLLYPSFCFLAMNAFATSVMIVVTGGIYGEDQNETIAQQPPLEQSADDGVHPTVENDEKSTRSDKSSIDNKVKEDLSSSSSSGNKGTSRVIGLLNNLFDAGSVTYLILWKIQEFTQTSMQTIIWGYLGMAFFTFGGSLFFWKLILTANKHRDANNQDAALINKNKPDAANLLQSDETPNDDQESNSRNQEPVDDEEDWKSLRSVPYLWLVAFFAFHIARNVFMLTSAEPFLKGLGDDDNKYITIFSVIMPASILGFPFVDCALTRYGFHAALQFINILGLIHGTIQVSTTNLNVQIVGFVVFSFYRCFLFSVIFAFLAVLMPNKVLGKANGFLHIAAGITGFLNIPLGNAAIQAWNGSFFIPNLIYTVGILPMFYAAYGTTAGIRKAQQQKNEDKGKNSSSIAKKVSSTSMIVGEIATA